MQIEPILINSNFKLKENHKERSNHQKHNVKKYKEKLKGRIIFDANIEI